MHLKTSHWGMRGLKHFHLFYCLNLPKEPKRGIGEWDTRTSHLSLGNERDRGACNIRY